MFQRFTLVALSFVITLGLCSQTPMGSFPLKNRNYSAFPVEAHVSDMADLLMLFESEWLFRLYWLDEDLNSLREIEIPKLLQDQNELDILGVVNEESRMFIYANVRSSGDHKVFELDKQAGTYIAQPLPFQPDRKDRLLKAFVFEDQFIELYINPKTRQLRICLMRGRTSSEEFTYDLMVPGFVDRFKKADKVGVARIGEDREASLAANTLTEKLYTFPGELIFSLEDQQLGETQFLVINTQTWELKAERYPVPGFLPNHEEQRLNSLIHDGYLFQLLVNRTGLAIHQVDMETSEVIRTLDYADDTEIQKFLGPFYQKRFTDNGPRVDEANKLMPHLLKASAISFYDLPNGETHMTIGAHRHMTKGAQNTLLIVSLLATAASYAYVPNFGGSNFWIGYDPYALFDLALDLAYLYGDDKFYYVETAVDPTTLDIRPYEPIASSFDLALSYMFEERLGERGYGLSLFAWQGKTILGYGRKKMYQFLSFESPDRIKRDER